MYSLILGHIKRSTWVSMLADTQTPVSEARFVTRVQVDLEVHLDTVSVPASRMSELLYASEREGEVVICERS